VGESGKSDAEILAAYAAGDAEAFGRLVSTHGGMVYHTCLRVTGERTLAEDAAQAAFVILARKARRVHGNVGAFLHGVAVNVARKARDAELARRGREREAAAMKRELEAVSGPDADWGAVRPHLDGAIGRLPRREREVVIRHYLEGASRSEVARTLGVPEGTVSSRLARALARLRKRLARKGAPLGTVVLGGVLAGRAAEAACPAFLTGAGGTLVTAGGVAGAAGSSALLAPKVAALVKGGLKAMFWAKMKAVACVTAAVAVAGGGAIAAGADGAVAKDEAIRAKVVQVELAPTNRPGMTAQVTLDKGAAHGVREGFIFEIRRDGKAVNRIEIRRVDAEGSVGSAFWGEGNPAWKGEIKVGDLATTKLTVVDAGAEDPAPPVAPAAWGEAVNGLRLRLSIEPAVWRPNAKVRLTCSVENVSDEAIRIRDWRSVWDGLILTDAGGRQIRPGGGANKSRPLMPDDFPIIAPGRSLAFRIDGRFRDGKLILPVSTGGIRHWPNMGDESLTPGAYVLTARLTDARKSLDRLSGALKDKVRDRLWPGPEARSAPVRIVVAGPEAVNGLRLRLVTKYEILLRNGDSIICDLGVEKQGQLEIRTYSGVYTDVPYAGKPFRTKVARKDILTIRPTLAWPMLRWENVGDKPLVFYRNRSADLRGRVFLQAADGRMLLARQFEGEVPKGMQQVRIEPGKFDEEPFAPWHWVVKPEKAGEYTLWVEFENHAVRAQSKNAGEVQWTGRVRSNKVRVTLGGKGAAGLAKPEWKQAIREKLKKKVSLEFVGTPAEEGLAFLQKMGQVNIVIDPACGDRLKAPVNLRVKDMPLEKALPWMLRLTGTKMTLKDGAIVILPREGGGADAPEPKAPEEEDIF